jgi:hypothetical protein
MASGGRRPRVKGICRAGRSGARAAGQAGCRLAATRALSAVRQRGAGYGSSSRNPWCSAKSLKSLRLTVASGSW